MTSLDAKLADADAKTHAWTPADSEALYGLAGWGQGYFAASEKGHVVIRPQTTPTPEIDLHEVVEGLHERGITAPLLLRFTDILAHRMEHLHRAFDRAIRENNYQGDYRAVYPIKVNHQRHVVEDVFRYGAPYGFGLEVGSKPELLAVLSVSSASPDRLIICNGFKDDPFIEAVTLATKLGREVIPVVENFEELRLIIKHSKRYDVRPTIGVRVKLASKGVGRWGGSVGIRSKFGLVVSEVLDMFRLLREHGMEDCLRLVHCHMGSQVQDIHRIKDVIHELGHVYAELVRMGAGLKYIDVGGGLGVDYTGVRSNVESSMNYSLEEYASDVVYRLGAICDNFEIDHPTIISESGRAMVAYHSVLVFNVFGSSRFDRFKVPATLEEALDAEGEDEEEIPQPIRDLHEAYLAVSPDRVLECYHDAVRAREESLSLFKLGYLSLPMRGLAERLFWATCARVAEAVHAMEDVPEELEDLEVILSDTYFGNFSVFQSLPDSWAIDQLFPVVPIHRLDEEPTRKAVLADITCDSDGKIDRFVEDRDVRSTLRVHPLRDDEPYYLGVFLVGAYQETLGDLHNLFGDTHVVYIRLDENGRWWIDETVPGDTARDVLGYMQYEVDRLYPRLARDCERAVRDGRLSVAESRVLLRFYEEGLNSYTYLETE